MLGRFTQWWRKRKLVKSGGLLRYFDGRRTRYGDPFQIWRVLQNQPATMQVAYLEQFIESGKEPEVSQLMDLTSQAFGSTRYDPATGEGLTDAETLGLLLQFARYVSAVKKNTSPGPTLPEPTGSPSSSGMTPLSEAESASSDCTSTPSEPTPAAPGAS